MLRKGNETKWTIEAKKPFCGMKKVITEAPVLVSPYLFKYFLIFSFASEHTIAGVLLQNNNGGSKKPIFLFS